MSGGLLVSSSLVLAAYLLGAIPFGLLLARKFAGVDVRETGSGNIGATNVARSAGRWLGLATLLLDAAKGAVPVLAAAAVLPGSTTVVALAGFASVIGHVLPVYLRFKGGKGVATALGVFVAITPIPTLIAAGAFAVTFAVFRVVSVGSLVGALALAIAVPALDPRREVWILAAAVVLIVLLRHRGNIERLLRRTEHRV